MKYIFGIILLISFVYAGGQTICDADSDCFYIPDTSLASERLPALIILSCTGATERDIDSVRLIGDSLRIILATCHESRNHRNVFLNDRDIMKTLEKLLTDYPTDPSMVFIYGFSGQGVQALMALFKHPNSFKGVISACGHTGAMSTAQWFRLADKRIYLISRKKDWNLDENRLMHNLFISNNVRDTMLITPGKHAPATSKELLNAGIWLLNIPALDK